MYIHNKVKQKNQIQLLILKKIFLIYNYKIYHKYHNMVQEHYLNSFKILIGFITV